jgi:hypothetical protein
MPELPRRKLAAIPRDPAFPKERWRFIPGYLHYAVSSYGRVFSFHTNRFRKCRVDDPNNKGAYLEVGLSEHGVAKCLKIHTLVLTAFRGPRSLRRQC